MRSIILMYHDIYSDITAAHIPRSAAMYHIPKQSFIKHLTTIKESKLSVLTVSELLDRKKSSTISLTFDDGWAGAFNIAMPILKEFGYRCTYFITKDFVGREGFIDEKKIIMAAEAGMEIGVHGTTHRMLSNCSKDEIIWEFTNCKEYLESLTGQKVVSGSIPGGDWNETIASCASDAGLKIFCNSNPGINLSNTNLFNLKRIPIKENTSDSDIQRYCQYNIYKELIKPALYQIPRRLLGMKRYSNFRRWLLGEKNNRMNEIFDP